MKKFVNEVPILDEGMDTIPLFLPHIPKGAIESVTQTLQTRWIGQGPKVEYFEKLISERFCDGDAGIAVGSGTDALHLAYLLAGIGPGDEVITPVFTCTATNIPLLYIGAQCIFADVDPLTMNIDLDHVERLITERTKAIIVVHYGGEAVDLDKLQMIIGSRDIKVIEDAAHALGGTLKGRSIGSISDFTMFSFQAIKHITTGDGGYLSFKNRELLEQAQRLRWFGINRKDKQQGVWENDIIEIGYKYQMTDIAAAIGIAGVAEFTETLLLRRKLYARYLHNLKHNAQVQIIGNPARVDEHASWLFSIRVLNRRVLQQKLLDHNIESNQVHYRNDRYSIFGSRRSNLPNMDKVEEEYLVLPLHTKMDLAQVDKICDVINSGW